MDLGAGLFTRQGEVRTFKNTERKVKAWRIRTKRRKREGFFGGSREKGRGRWRKGNSEKTQWTNSLLKEKHQNDRGKKKKFLKHLIEKGNKEGLNQLEKVKRTSSFHRARAGVPEGIEKSRGWGS